MKLSVAVAGEKALPSAFVVWRGFERSIKQAAEFGYNGIELALKTADEVNPASLSRWLDQAGIEVSCISTGQVFADLGLYFTHPDPEMRKKTINVFSELIRLAKDFGKMINVGRTRGFIAKEQSGEECERLFIETTKELCDIAEPLDVKILIEPVNRYEINFINNLDEGAAILRKISAPNLGLMPDVFHMNIEDDKIGESLLRNSEYVDYIHLADSNRLAPGNGHLDFSEVFQALKGCGFSGWASIEIFPKPTPDTAARQAVEYISPRIQEYNRS